MIEPTLLLNFTGVRVDIKRLERVTQQLSQRNLLRVAEIYKLVGHPFKLGSPKDLVTVLFNELGLPVTKRSKVTGQPSTDQEVLEELQSHHPVVPLIKKWRVESKLVTAYSTKIPRSVELNGRIYPAFHSIGSVSGRLTSSAAESSDGEDYGTNFQNVASIPFDMEQLTALKVPEGIDVVSLSRKSLEEVIACGCTLSKMGEPGVVMVPISEETDVRTSFLPLDGWVWMKVDFSQVEYRIMASLAGEESLVEGFKRGVDYHTQTASIMFNKPIDQVTKSDRQNGKILNFGLSYGMSPKSLAKRTGMSEAEAVEKYQIFFNKTPKLVAFTAGVKSFVKNNGYIKTFFGRVRHFDLDSIPFQNRESVLRASFNTVIQGTAADILKIATVRVAKAIKPYRSVARVLLSVHDELDLEVRKEEVDEVAAVIKRAMEIPVPEEWAPIVVDIKVGPSWSDKHLVNYEVKKPLQVVPFSSWKDIFEQLKRAG